MLLYGIGMLCGAAASVLARVVLGLFGLIPAALLLGCFAWRAEQRRSLEASEQAHGDGKTGLTEEQDR